VEWTQNSQGFVALFVFLGASFEIGVRSLCMATRENVGGIVLFAHPTRETWISRFSPLAKWNRRAVLQCLLANG
jgi:hypothetical protein